MLTTFNSVKENDKEYEIKSFTESGEFFCGCKANKDSLSPLKRQEIFTNSAISHFEKIYNVAGRIFAYANHYLYEIKDMTIAKLTRTRFEKAPIIFNAPVCLGNSVIIGDGEKFISVGDENGTVYFPKGKKYAVNNDNVFTFNKNALLFGVQNGNGFYLKQEGYGRIDLDESLGDIVDIFFIDNLLYVIAEYGVQSISLLQTEKDFALKNTIALPVCVKEKTVTKIGNDLMFIAGKKLCKISNGKLVYLDAFFEDKDFIFCDNALSFNGKYCMPFTADGKKYLYSYSLLDESEEIFDISNSTVCDGGFFADVENNIFGKLDCGNGCTFTWESKTLNFDSIRNKNVYQIEILGRGSFEVTLSGDFGVRKFFVKANKPLKRVNAFSREYALKIESLCVDARINRLRLLYRE